MARKFCINEISEAKSCPRQLRDSRAGFEARSDVFVCPKWQGKNRKGGSGEICVSKFTHDQILFICVTRGGLRKISVRKFTIVEFRLSA